MFRTNARMIIAAGLAAACLSAPTRSAETRAPSVFSHFVTRQGDRLMEGPTEWRGIGANMPGLVLPYDFTLRIPARMTLPAPWEQEDAFKTLSQMGLRCVRTWNLPIRDPSEDKAASWKHVLGPGEFNEQSMRVIDNALALANRYGVRMILPLTAEAGDYLGGIGTYAAHRGKKRSDFYTDPQLKEDFKATLRYVANRRNTVTGTLYKDDPAILCWELGNELRTAPLEWEAEMAAYLRSQDPNHLVMAGRDDRVPDDPPADLDIVTRHYYGGDWVKNCRTDRAKARGKRPFIVGEFGLSADVQAVKRFLDEAIANGTSAALLWSMYFHHRDGGFYWHQIFTHPSIWSYHWPGFESGRAHRERDLLAALRDAAFAARGENAPALPAPEPPELLPIGRVPMMSWRGSAGAAAYDVQRAPAPEGPWTSVAAGVSDADTAYRPLFSDTSARPGETWFYRVIARNASGASAPSNVVGPVKVDRTALADELKDFSLAHSKSDGLVLTNDYNALYAEYLFRAKGDAGQWLTYRTERSMAAVRIVAFYIGESPCLGLQVSADGRTFADLPASVSRQRFAGVGRQPGRTLVEYAAQPPAGRTFLKIIWTGPAELDRVEIEY